MFGFNHFRLVCDEKPETERQENVEQSVLGPLTQRWYSKLDACVELLIQIAEKRDVERFLKGFGYIKEVKLMTGFGFVEARSDSNK